MNGLFVFLLLLILGLLVWSMLTPKKLAKLLSKDNQKKLSRKHFGIVFGGLAILLFVLVGTTAPKTKHIALVNSAATVAATTKPVTKPQPVATKTTATTQPTIASLDSQAKAIFLPVTQSYITLYNQGEADAALSDPSTYLTWSDSFVSTNDPRLDASLTAYNKAAALYQAANQKQPSALKNWFDDNENVYTDISKWSADEYSDLGTSTTSSTVIADLQLYNQDITATQNDLNSLVSGTSLPLATIPASTSTSTTSTTSAGSCYPTASSGNCYEPGEYCSDADHGMSGVAGNGKSITCEDNDGWRWEP
jgi:hypothetical protein